MKARIAMIGATLAILFANGALANPREADVTMTVDDAAPIRATLMPTVSIDATPATSESNPPAMRIADTAPLEVTLMPTVRVTAKRNPELAATLLPTVRVTATVERYAGADAAVPDLPLIDDESPATVEPSLALRAYTMPR